MKVYLLPGVGCDARLFDRIQLGAHEVTKLEWPEFTAGITLADIARALSGQVDKSRPHVLVGVSMGGMVAQELAVLTNPEKVVLISSWTGPQEWPFYVRAGAALGFPGLIREWSMRMVWPLKRLIDRRSSEIDQLLWDMAVKQSARKLRLGTTAVLRWKGSTWKGRVIRIHGDKDIVTPLRFQVDHLVKGGQHVMVLTRADEVSRLLLEAISS
jgi:pimeloyl-ACP methyl ester carboxylesterase